MASGGNRAAAIMLHLFTVNKNVCDPAIESQYEPRREKTNIPGFDLVRHKLDCTATEDC